jgi:hypothetical protein
MIQRYHKHGTAPIVMHGNSVAVTAVTECSITLFVNVAFDSYMTRGGWGGVGGVGEEAR